MKSKSTENVRTPSPAGIADVVSPRGVTYSATCHQWFTIGACDSRVLPTICVHMCSVASVSAHESSGNAGQRAGADSACRRSVMSQHTRGRTASQETRLSPSPRSTRTFYGMSETSRPRAVVLLSGGLDSTTVLAVAQRDGFDVAALTVRYGQRHAAELHAASRIAQRMRVARHEIISLDLRAFGGSALTADIPVPKDRDEQKIGSGIPITYVPARNTIFLALALAFAETLDAADIFIGVNALDYSGYPDCRPAFIEAFERLANLATKAGVDGASRFRIHAPLLHLAKSEIIALGLSLGVDYAGTCSCYDPLPTGEACGRCDACLLRLRGFAAAGARDPIAYAAARR